MATLTSLQKQIDDYIEFLKTDNTKNADGHYYLIKTGNVMMQIQTNMESMGLWPQDIMDTFAKELQQSMDFYEEIMPEIEMKEPFVPKQIIEKEKKMLLNDLRKMLIADFENFSKNLDWFTKQFFLLPSCKDILEEALKKQEHIAIETQMYFGELMSNIREQTTSLDFSTAIFLNAIDKSIQSIDPEEILKYFSIMISSITHVINHINTIS